MFYLLQFKVSAFEITVGRTWVSEVVKIYLVEFSEFCFIPIIFSSLAFYFV